MANNPYTAYPEGFEKLQRTLKMPFFFRFMRKKLMPLFLKILIDG